MSGDDSDEVMVPNPLLHAIDSLKTRTETAVSETPNMNEPTGSIGPGPAWTGPAARQVHDDHLALHAEAVASALNHIVQDVEDAKGDIESPISANLARVIRYDLQMR